MTEKLTSVIDRLTRCLFAGEFTSTFLPLWLANCSWDHLSTLHFAFADNDASIDSSLAPYKRNVNNFITSFLSVSKQSDRV